MTRRKTPDDYTPSEIDAWAARNESQLAALERLRRQRQRSDWDKSRERAMDRGISLTKPPIGYDRIDGRLVPGSHAAAVVAAFEARAAGKTWQETAEVLTAGASSGNGVGWSPESVRRIIRNPVYVGDVVHGDLIREGVHPRIVSDDLFNLANGVASPLVTRQVYLGPSLLAGVIRCAGCRYLLKPDTIKGQGGSKVRAYRCRGRHAGGKCANSCFSLASVVEPYVTEHLMRLIGTRTAQNSAMDLSPQVQEVEDARHELETFRDDPRMISAIGADAMVDGLVARAQRVQQAEAALHEARSQTLGMQSEREVRAMWPDMTIDQQRSILTAVYGAIFMRASKVDDISERLLFMANGDEPDDLPRRGRGAMPLKPLNWTAASRKALRRY